MQLRPTGGRPAHEGQGNERKPKGRVAQCAPKGAVLGSILIGAVEKRLPNAHAEAQSQEPCARNQALRVSEPPQRKKCTQITKREMHRLYKTLKKT